MSTVSADQLADTIQNLHDTGLNALADETVESFINLERFVNEVEAYVREVQQAMWSEPCGAVIRRLEQGEPITEADKEVLRTFLISDAERYLAHENNYDDWKRELRRLLDDLARRAEAAGRENVADLRGILKDAIRLIPDLRNYLEERRRVEKFEQALKSLDDASRIQLVQLLKNQLASSSR